MSKNKRSDSSRYKFTKEADRYRLCEDCGRKLSKFEQLLCDACFEKMTGIARDQERDEQ